MVPQIEIKHTLDDLAARMGLYPAEKMAAFVRAANRSISTTRRASTTALQREYPGIKVANLRRRLPITRATRVKPAAALTFSGRRIPLYGNFGMRARGQFGVGFRSLPWRLEGISGDAVTPAILARAFRNRSRRSGRAVVFARWTKYRGSLEPLVAPGLARAFTERAVGAAMRQVALNRFEVVFIQEAKFRLGKR